MNFIKKYKSSAIAMLAVAMLLSFAGCRKQLDYTPEVFLSAQQVYKDEPGAVAGVTGIYRQLNVLKQSDYALIGIIGTDEARCTYQSQGYGAYWAGVTGMDVYDIQFNSQNADISGYWTVCYQGIANANLALQYIPQIKGFADPSVQSRLMGEASFMRALFYFQLVQLYGDLPLRLQNMSFADGVPRSPQAKVYDQIVTDLKFAIANLWLKAKNPDPGRASIEAAKALLGKVYLTEHDYTDAKTVLGDLVQTGGLTLLSDYSQLFDGKHENNAESLFEIQYSTDAGNSQSLQNLFGSYAGPPIPFESFDKHTPGYGGTVVMSTAYYSDTVFHWQKNPNQPVYDTRYAASINHDRYDSNGNTMSWWVDPGLPTIKKYDISSSDIDAYTSGKNLYVLRSADVYLMYAETLNELGSTTDALVQLNKVRVRAQRGNYEDELGHTPSQAELRDDLQDERIRELGGEGWRWFDLKRTGQLVQRVRIHNNPKVSFMLKNGTSDDPHPAQNVTDKNNLYPIPLSELQNNQALTLGSQNPGY